MADPNVHLMLTRIEVLERRVAELEREIEKLAATWDASACPHGTDETEGWCAQCAAGLPGPATNSEDPSQTHTPEADLDRAIAVARYRHGTVA